MSQLQPESRALFADVALNSEHISNSNATKVKPKRQRGYRPLVLRTVPLLVLLAVTGVFIGLLQYALHRLPHVDGHEASRIQESFEEAACRNDLRRKDVVESLGSIEGVSTALSPSSSASINSEGLLATLTWQYIPDTSTKYDSVYIPTSSASNVEATETFVMETQPLATTITLASAYIRTRTTLTTLLTKPDAYMPIQRLSSVDVPSSTRPDAYMPTQISSLDAAALSSYTAASMPSPSDIIAGAPPNEWYMQPAITVSVTCSPTALVMPTGAAQKRQSQIQVKTLVFTWSQGQTFIGSYLVVLLTVLYKIYLSEVQNNITLIEPFRQMVSEEGATSQLSLFSFYQRRSIRTIILAVSNGRYLASFSTISQLLACLLPALGSEAIWIDTGEYCGFEKTEDDPNPCPARIVASVIVVRVMQAIFAILFVVISGVMTHLFVERSGLLKDPSSMAVVANLMHHPKLADDLRRLQIHPETKMHDLSSALAASRYRLCQLGEDMEGRSQGVYPVGEAEGEKAEASETAHTMFPMSGSGYRPIDPNSSHYRKRSASNRWRWLDFLLLLVLAGTFALVLAYYKDSSNSGFNNFFNSDTFGPRFILTLVGTIIAKSWQNVELSAVIMAPYVVLFQRPASYRHLAFKPTTTPLLSTFRALRHEYWAVAIISITTLLSEALNVLISGVPYSTGQVATQLSISALTSLAILGIMIVIAIVVIFRRKHEPKLPVKPDTLGAKIAYMSGSVMLEDLCDDGESEKVQDRRLRSLGKKYRFTQDDKGVWLVDEVRGKQEAS